MTVIKRMISFVLSILIIISVLVFDISATDNQKDSRDSNIEDIISGGSDAIIKPVEDLSFGAEDKNEIVNPPNTNAKGAIASITSAKIKYTSQMTSDQKKALKSGLISLKKDKIIGLNGDWTLDSSTDNYSNNLKLAVTELQKLLNANGANISVDGYWGNNTAKAFKKSKYNKYKFGGLNDYTGIAWLDGTPSRPEMVLDAKDTENFIQLKDILRDLSNSPTSDGAKGDAYYNININVDQLANDYDVDRLMNRIKKEITTDSSYRNVNQVRRSR